jgi:preprotein translocase subunit SecG
MKKVTAKKVTAVVLSLVCVVSLNLAFASSSKPKQDGQTTTQTDSTKRPRFQR